MSGPSKITTKAQLCGPGEAAPSACAASSRDVLPVAWAHCDSALCTAALAAAVPGSAGFHRSAANGTLPIAFTCFCVLHCSTRLRALQTVQGLGRSFAMMHVHMLDELKQGAAEGMTHAEASVETHAYMYCCFESLLCVTRASCWPCC